MNTSTFNPWQMNLQLFAEPTADGQQPTGQQDPQTTNPTDPNANEPNNAQPTGQQANQQQMNQPGGQQGSNAQQNGGERTFSQAELDRIVADRLARQQRSFQQQLETARQEGRTEAERLAQMSAEERARHEQEEAQRQAQTREQALAQREADISRRELRAQAIDTLVTRGLPRELESILIYSSADACNASIANVEKVFRAAVQQSVDERLRQSGVNLPAPGGQPDYSNMSDADYYALRYKNK